jgi:hypothetical protein
VAAPAPIISPSGDIETETLTDIGPEAIGLLTSSQGSLGPAMWQGTPHLLAERLLPALGLPTPSPVLNDMARRLLLTTANAPEGGVPGAPSLVSLRLAQLVALGNAAEAWKLSQIAKPDQVDEATLLQVVQAGLVSDAADEICAKTPDFIKQHTAAEWQKALLICQMRVDPKSAQVTLDLLHGLSAGDPFVDLAEKNILAGNKNLPRQLTPLRPATLALLKLTKLPLPAELFMRADAALIPMLLDAPARDDNAKLALAERAALRGLITPGWLAAVYSGVTFSPEALAAPDAAHDNTPRTRALLYQAAKAEKDQTRVLALAVKFAQSLPVLPGGAMPRLLADLLAPIRPTNDMAGPGAMAAQLYIAAGRMDGAAPWVALLRQAAHGANGSPADAVSWRAIWPHAVLAGLVPEANYAADLKEWVDGTLKGNEAGRIYAAQILNILDAAGFAVPMEDWAQAATMPVFERKIMPPAWLFDRLNAAGNAKRRAETAMLAVILANNETGAPAHGANNTTDTVSFAAVVSVRALKAAGLTADAMELARETVRNLKAP